MGVCLQGLSKDDLVTLVGKGRPLLADCTSLASLSLPATLTTIGSDAFSGCTLQGLSKDDLVTLGFPLDHAEELDQLWQALSERGPASDQFALPADERSVAAPVSPVVTGPLLDSSAAAPSSPAPGVKGPQAPPAAANSFAAAAAAAAATAEDGGSPAVVTGQPFGSIRDRLKAIEQEELERRMPKVRLPSGNCAVQRVVCSSLYLVHRDPSQQPFTPPPLLGC